MTQAEKIKTSDAQSTEQPARVSWLAFKNSFISVRSERRGIYMCSPHWSFEDNTEPPSHPAQLYLCKSHRSPFLPEWGSNSERQLAVASQPVCKKIEKSKTKNTKAPIKCAFCCHRLVACILRQVLSVVIPPPGGSVFGCHVNQVFSENAEQ